VKKSVEGFRGHAHHCPSCERDWVHDRTLNPSVWKTCDRVYVKRHDSGLAYCVRAAHRLALALPAVQAARGKETR
jgi:ribosomal protein L37AE/L43A